MEAPADRVEPVMAGSLAIQRFQPFEPRSRAVHRRGGDGRVDPDHRVERLLDRVLSRVEVAVAPHDRAEDLRRELAQ